MAYMALQMHDEKKERAAETSEAYQQNYQRETKRQLSTMRSIVTAGPSESAPGGSSAFSIDCSGARDNAEPSWTRRAAEDGSARPCPDMRTCSLSRT